MADSSFFTNTGPYSLQELAKVCGAELTNTDFADLMIIDVSPLDVADSGHISFLSNPKYTEQFSKTNASACIVSKEAAALAPDNMAILVANDPYKAYARVAAHFYPPVASDGQVHPTAVIHETARLGENVSVGAYTVIDEGVRIGRDTIIGAHCHLEKNVKIGRNCQINSQTSLKACHLGDNVTLHNGVRIGCDGFGFAPDPAGHVKIPQLGRVIIGSFVEIGANTTVDRGAGPDTIIGDGCWIDNLCQIGHNVKMGRGCILASQTGISGSTELEDFVVLGGQVGLAGHIKIGTGTQVTAKSGVISDIPAGQVYAGFPARPRKEFFRSMAVLGRLAKGKGRK
ncbi:UDP-3-O-(3-hydroxymyristoyl)glucosamine N-acyltransferase [Sneathiella glossodoripedis]|uniref:UDP-3-O-(3-hydroxymyristoyl)glucosamine N-acyltransferase n=1 Tax=Sneathiella glossodoripedis TaxID=418853 RepID=UPI0004709DEB|nr:UDP-3-O-(3-hydroxymyristoyl)glucosamine N-acyltransferase [Sneathiella glossodoripedis]